MFKTLARIAGLLAVCFAINASIVGGKLAQGDTPLPQPYPPLPGVTQVL